MNPDPPNINLQPKAQSRTATVEKNDPLVNEALLIEGVSGMVQRTTRRRFTVDLSAYSELVRASYDTQMTSDRSLKKYISLSMYQYYCTILLWRRLWQVQTRRGLFTIEYLRLTGVLNFEMPIPNDISIYLEGLGDIIDQSNREFNLTVRPMLTNLAVVGVQGNYGQIGLHNHLDYETIPSPFVAYWNMVADMNRTTLPPAQGPVDWDLPAEARPANNVFELPTMNLLGYNRAIQFTTDQRSAMEACGVEPYPPHNPQAQNATNVSHLPVNQALLQFVGGQLLNSKCKAYITNLKETLLGSLAQVLYTTRTPDDVEKNRLIPISAKNGVTNSYCQTNVHVACGAANFRYRIQRRRGHEEDMVCYAPADEHVIHTKRWKGQL
jgi:hypothetical protein